MAITCGFGMTMDIERGTMRRWYMRRGDVKRWLDTDQPVEQVQKESVQSVPHSTIALQESDMLNKENQK